MFFGVLMKHLVEEPDARFLTAERVGNVGVDIVVAHAEPVDLRAVGRERLVVSTESQRLHPRRVRLEAVALARGLGDGAPARDDRGGLMPRAHDDGGVNGAGVADEIGAR